MSVDILVSPYVMLACGFVLGALAATRLGRLLVWDPGRRNTWRDLDSAEAALRLATRALGRATGPETDPRMGILRDRLSTAETRLALAKQNLHVPLLSMEPRRAP